MLNYKHAKENEPRLQQQKGDIMICWTFGRKFWCTTECEKEKKKNGPQRNRTDIADVLNTKIYKIIIMIKKKK